AKQTRHGGCAETCRRREQEITTAERLALDEILDKGRHWFLPNPRLKRLRRCRGLDSHHAEPGPRTGRSNMCPTPINALTSYFFKFTQVKWFSRRWQQEIEPAGFDGWQYLRV